MSKDKRLLGDRFDRALAYATHLHREQLRKGSGVPYVAHLLGVTSLVLEDGGNEDEAIAALLHDAVEDQGGHARLEEIEREFGNRVARIVEGCTDADVTPKPRWRSRKEAYVRALASHEASVRRVALADKLYNAPRDPARLSTARRRALEALQPRIRPALVLPRPRLGFSRDNRQLSR